MSPDFKCFFGLHKYEVLEKKEVTKEDLFQCMKEGFGTT